MAPGDYSDGHRQQLLRELQRKLQARPVVVPTVQEHNERLRQAYCARRANAAVSSCQQQTLPVSQARPPG
eukprot:1732264-Pleurochrysis_carterae.AAC.1